MKRFRFVAPLILGVLSPLPAAAQASVFVLNLAGTPVGEIPTGIKQLSGMLEVVLKDGVPMLKASARSEFLITLPQVLPADFTLEFELVPKACCNPQDLSFEGTPTINQGAGSAHILWDSDGYLAIIGGAQDNYEAPMPEDLRATLPGVLTSVVAVFQGSTVRLYTNGRRMYTLDRTFARGRVLRVFLGGQDDGSNAVHLAGMRVVAGAALPGAVAANPTSPPGQPAPGPGPAPAPPPGQPAPPSGQPTPPPGQPAPETPPAQPPTPTPFVPPPTSRTPVEPLPTGAGGRPTPTLPPAPPDPSGILVGTGISDITGPMAEVGMMGYGDPGQQTAGLHMRLFARAFVFAAPGGGKRVAFVSAELQGISSSVKQGVVKKLDTLYPGRYDDRNVMISATHTHSGPGGYAHHALFNIMSFGHIAQNYAAIVDGITEAISKADSSLAPATVSVMSGEVTTQTMVNRSMPAYTLNPDARSIPPRSAAPTGPAPPLAWISYAWPDSVNREMTVLKIQKGGSPVGAIAWHAVHNVSMRKENRLISSDAKGYASHLFEKQYGSIAPLQNYGAFIAAFPNGAEGDMSPNIMGPDTTRGEFKGPGGNDFESTYIIGERQFDVAHTLFTLGGHTPIPGDIDFRHKFVTMPGLLVTSNHTNGVGGKFLCPPAYGVSFNAGSEDGQSGPAVEGLALGSTMSYLVLTEMRRILTGIIGFLIPPLGPVVAGAMIASSDPCQLPKPVLIPSGSLPNWSPAILPFQLLRLGPVAIAGIPGEMTMQAGRRLQDSLKVVLAPLGVQRVILTGLANEYSSYITTPEEYDSQQYEGASTIYGRLTFDAYQQIFRELAVAMVTGQPAGGGPPPPDLGLLPQIELQPGVVRDEWPVEESFRHVPAEPWSFGLVLRQPPKTVSRGAALVHVTFRSGHPKNDLRRNNSYLRIEREVPTSSEFPDGWKLEAWDAMPETMLFWARSPNCPGTPSYCSQIDVHWRVPPTTTPGTYRIRLVGSWKNGATGALTRYQGRTDTFTVQ